jgi:hypothetical protein
MSGGFPRFDAAERIAVECLQKEAECQINGLYHMRVFPENPYACGARTRLFQALEISAGRDQNLLKLSEITPKEIAGNAYGLSYRATTLRTHATSTGLQDSTSLLIRIEGKIWYNLSGTTQPRQIE